MEGLPTWAKVGIGVIGAAIAITTGVGATYVATTMAKSAISGAIFNGAIYGVSSLVTGHFDKTEFINSMLNGAADMFMVSGVMLGAKGVVDCVARNSGRIREAMLANEEGSSNAVERIDDFYESRVSGGSYTPKNKTKLWGQEKYVTEKGLNTVKQHLSGEMEADFNNAMIERLENAYKNNAKISGADLDFYSHEIYESMMMKNGMSYEAAHEAAKAYYNAVEFNLYHPDVIMQYKREFNPAWFRFWGIEEN